MKILMLIASLALAGCSPSLPSAGPADAAHSSRDALDWPGTYIGTTPCADCEGVRTTLTLEREGTFSRERNYLGKSASPMQDAGSFSWDAAGTVITLALEPDSSQQYRVAEHRLLHLDRMGLPITGALAGRYVLEQTKQDPRIEDRRWLLTEVMGRPVEAADMPKESFIRFDSAQRQVIGNASCNDFFGGYALLAGNRIRMLGNLGATRMACPEMRVEAAFLEALETVDNYALDGERLTFSRARMAPLLVFRPSPEDT